MIPAGAGVRGEDPGGASSRGVGVGAESVPMQGPGSGGAGVEAEPVLAGAFSPWGAGVSRAVPGGATIEGAGQSWGYHRPGHYSSPPTRTGTGTRPVFAVHVRNSWSWSERRESWSGSSWSYSSWRSGSSSSRRCSSCSSSRSSRSNRSSSSIRSRSSHSGSRSRSSSSHHLCFLSLVFGPSVSPLPLLPTPLLPFSTSASFVDVCASFSPESALNASFSTPVTDYYRAFRPVLSRVLTSLVTDPRASLSSVSALTAAFTAFASTRRLDYATSIVAAPPTSPLVVGGESALGCDALEDGQFELDFLAHASPHLCAMPLAPEGCQNIIAYAFV
ncbi:unnamed protein product [Closterium sp. NIES-53]